jgi:hypothetical protein
MSRTITLTNVSGSAKTYSGQTINDTETYTLDTDEYLIFRKDQSLMVDVTAGLVLVGDGAQTFSDAVQGWEWLQNTLTEVEISQKTVALGNKVAVHSSAKPELQGEPETFVVWTGAGDSTDPNVVGGGDLLNFQMTIGTPEVIKDIKFNHAEFGRVWIHEAYLKFDDGGIGDYVSAYIMSEPTPLQTLANLDLVLEAIPEVPGAHYVKYSPGGPGTGTHGFAGNPTLIPRTFNMDGDWDFEDGNLTPNFAGTGRYNMVDVDWRCSKYVNKVPCFGSASNYFTMSSDETAEIRPGYYLRIHCKNISNTNWQASVIMEIYRQRTVW